MPENYTYPALAPMGAALEGALRSLLEFLISCRDMVFSLKRSVGDSSYTSFSSSICSSGRHNAMSADTLIACPLACQAQSSMYRSVTRSYTSLFSRKCKKGRFDYIYQFLRNPIDKITLFFIRTERNLKKLKFLTSFAGPRRFSAKCSAKTKSQQTALRARSYAQ